jgi:hypothetical protein
MTGLFARKTPTRIARYTPSLIRGRTCGCQVRFTSIQSKRSAVDKLSDWYDNIVG